MLRRKLLIILGSLVVLLVAMCVGAIWMLQDVFTDLAHIENEALVTVEKSNKLSTAVGLIQVELYRLQLGTQRHLDPLIISVEGVRQLAEQIGQHYVARETPAAELYDRIINQLPQFERNVGALATAQDPALARTHNQAALASAVAINQDALTFGRLVRDHARREQQQLSSRFRWLVLGLAIMFVLVINVSIIVLLRTAEMILKPIDRLVHASRELGRERFEHRIELDRKDEFDELAGAYNHLAEQLQANEQRKIEMLGQVALTLNHELNNAIAIIELQLSLLGRQSNGHGGQEKSLRQIRESLERMTKTVESLKRVRRIVLTDYVAGMKMLDLERSTEADPAGEPEGAPCQPPAQAPA